MTSTSKNVCTLILILGLLSGCRPDPTAVVPPAEEKTVTAPATSTATVEPSATQTQIIRQSPTSTSMPSSLTPQPTFSSDYARTFIQDNLKNNGGCKLPCVIGFTPGKTPYKSIYYFLSHFSQRNIAQLIEINVNLLTSGGMLNASLWDNDTRVNLNWFFTNLNGNLNQVFFSTEVSHEEGKSPDLKSSASFGNPYFQQLLEYYSLPRILTTYGKPDFVFVAPEPGDSRIVGDFDLALVYLEQGFFVEYIFPKDEVKNNFSGCPFQSAYIKIVTWLPIDKNIQNKDVPFYGSRLTLDYFKSLDQATRLTIDEFHQKFKTPNNTFCLETPVNIWTP